MTKPTKKILSYLFKATILVLAFGFIYHQYIKKGDNLKLFKSSIGKISHVQVIVVMSAVVVLMLVNWILESIKWQYLTKKLVKITIWEAIEGVFSGLTWAIFTPNRLGEYGGRVMFLPTRWRIHGVFAMGVGSFGQNVITNVLGSCSLVWFVYTFLHVNTLAFVGIIWSAFIVTAVFLLFYFNIKLMVWLLKGIPYVKKYHRFFDVMGQYRLSELCTIMGFCLARFFVFSFQYYLVIHLLIPEIPLYEIMLMVFIVFFIQSALPSLDLLDVAVRSTAAATIFAYVTHQQVAIIAAFTSIWLINLIIPAILGSLFTFNMKFFDRNL